MGSPRRRRWCSPAPLDNIVVVGAEVHSAALDLSTSVGATWPRCSAMARAPSMVSATEEDRGIRSWHLGADGRHADALSQKVWDIRKRPFIPQNEEGIGQVAPDYMFARMEGRLVFKNAVERMIGALMKEFQKQNLTLDDVDLFFFHQANLRINQYVAKQLGLSEEKLFHNIERYGNTTAATIPIMLAEAQGQGEARARHEDRDGSVSARASPGARPSSIGRRLLTSGRGRGARDRTRRAPGRSCTRSRWPRGGGVRLG